MTTAPLFSEHWYRFKDTKPRLARDVNVHRHVYRGIPCYVLQRSSTVAYCRVDQHVYELISHLDGRTSVGELWERAIESQGTDAPNQSDLIGLLAQLHEAELLTVDRTLNAEQLFSLGKDKERSETQQRYLNPLYLRFTLFDPDRLLTTLSSLLGGLFSRSGFVVWLLLIVFSLTQVLPRSTELASEISSFDFMSPLHAGLFFVLYPLLKLFHELAHGVVVKRNGGEVHELGIALMVLLPIPYVDASSAAVFPDKYSRIFVGAAGIFLELTLAAVGALVWAVSVSGPVHDVALMVMLVSGLSTVIFNANPLLKFDGYYILADAIEIPNLSDRARTYLLALGKKHFFGLSVDGLHTNDVAEGIWLAAYGLLSSVYRLVLMLTIAYLLSEQYFFVGVLLALWALFNSIALPLWRFTLFLLVQTRDATPRVLLVTTLFASLIASGVFWLQLPTSTVVKGVVWLPDNAIVRTTHHCEVTQKLVANNQMVEPGTPLIRCEDPALATEAKVLQAQVDALQAERAGVDPSDRVRLDVMRNEVKTAEAELQLVQEQLNEQLVTADFAGRFVRADETMLIGRFLDRGEIAAYIVPPEQRTVRLALGQSEIGDINNTLQAVQIQFTAGHHEQRSYASSISRLTPKASLQVPSPALTSIGGGDLAADPQKDGYQVLEPVFDLEIAWPALAPPTHIGSHVQVKFEHTPQPLASRISTALHRAFLGRLDT